VLGLIIIATSDAHLPIGEADLISAVEKGCRENTSTDLLILAGDMVERGRIEFYSKAWEILRKCEPMNVVATFGNDEYDELREKIREEYTWANWLDDSTLTIETSSPKMMIFGTTGILDVPTRWQRKNIPNIEKKYEERLRKFEHFLNTSFSGIKIAVFHYPPTYKTLHGEPSYAWPEMGSIKAEELIRRFDSLELVIHGHAHRSKVLHAKIASAEVFNVALPARKSLFIYEIRTKKTLFDFYKNFNMKSSATNGENWL
jgi:Icc-related predicted phosphoesterase